MPFCLDEARNWWGVKHFFFSFTNHCQSTWWTAQWWFITIEIFLYFFLFTIFTFSCWPPSLSGTPVRSSLSCWLKDIWFLPQISDLWLLFLRHVVRLGNSLNKTEHLKAPLAATLEALLLLTSNRTKVVWTERLTFRSAEPPVLPVEGLKIKKYLIYFMAGHWGENIKEPNDKKRVRKKKTCTNPSVWTRSLKVALF